MTHDLCSETSGQHEWEAHLAPGPSFHEVREATVCKRCGYTIFSESARGADASESGSVAHAFNEQLQKIRLSQTQ